MDPARALPDERVVQDVGRVGDLHEDGLLNIVDVQCSILTTLWALGGGASGSITTLTSLDYLGFGLPPGSASLGELLKQGRNNLQAPWLGISGFVVISLILSLLIFVGEATRDAFDPRKTFK